MEKTEEKNIYKTLAVILAVLIVIVLIGGVLLMAVSGSGKSASGTQQAEKTELTAAAPSAEEMTTVEQMTISAGSPSKKTEKEDEDNASETSGDYILPESNTKLLTSADIAGLSQKELNYAKNEIYARHGRKFQSKELQEYFASKSWYEGKYDGTDFDKNYSNSLLSDIEKKNAEFLKNAEEAMGSGGYKLDQ